MARRETGLVLFGTTYPKRRKKAKKGLKSLPPKPKKTASVQAKMNWIAKVKEIIAYNRAVMQSWKKSVELDRQIDRMVAEFHKKSY